MTESATKKKTSSSPSSWTTPDWSLLPDELLHIISENLDDSFDVVHARSVCSSWRSTFPFPSGLLRPSYSLPSFVEYPDKSKGLCTLEKFPLFLFIVQTPPAAASEYFLGGIGGYESKDHMELPSPLQCSVKVKMEGSHTTLMNMRDNQIIPLGHQYKMIGCNPNDYRCVAFLPLNKEGGGGFAVLLGFSRFVLMLRSSEMRWKHVKEFENPICDDIITFRGRFYATIHVSFMMHTFRIDPLTLHVTQMMPLWPLRSRKYLVPSGNDDELFLVGKVNSPTGVLDFSRFTCRVSRLNEKAGKWVEVSHLGDRVLLIGDLGNVSCSAKELPDGCGLSGNSILFTNEQGNGTYAYKYGVQTGREEDDLYFWRFSGEKRVTILSTSPVVAFRVER